MFIHWLLYHKVSCFMMLSVLFIIYLIFDTIRVGDTMYTFNESIKNHLSQSDETMAFLIKHLPLKDKTMHYDSLLSGIIAIIISQQLALSVAEKLFQAFKARFSPLTQAHLNTFSARDFKEIGLSNAKSETIKRLLNTPLDENLMQASNETIFKTLTSIKGIGPWSAEMVIMFMKKDMNYFSFNDGGIKNALKIFYPNADYQTLVDKFHPYKSYACIILWEALAYKKILLEKMEENYD